MSDGSPTVAFRIEPGLYDELVRRSINAGVGPNQSAKQMVIEALASDTPSDDLKAELEETRRALVKLREDFATSMEVLLMSVHRPDKSATIDDIRAWVNKNLRKA